MLAGSQVSRFLVLHRSWTPTTANSPTNKGPPGLHRREIRRAGGCAVRRPHRAVHRDQVKFEDGRTGSVSATLKLSDTKTFAPVKKA